MKKNQENLGGSLCRVKCFFEGIQDLAPGLMVYKLGLYLIYIQSYGCLEKCFLKSPFLGAIRTRRLTLQTGTKLEI